MLPGTRCPLRPHLSPYGVTAEVAPAQHFHRPSSAPVSPPGAVVMELPFATKNKQQAVGIGTASFSLQPRQATLVPAARSAGTVGKPAAARGSRYSAGSRRGSGSRAGQGHLLSSCPARNVACCRALGKALLLSAA